MLNGKDLIIECDGKPLAAAKSCSIEVNAETIQVSDIVHGGWEHYRAGRKSWKMKTNQQKYVHAAQENTRNGMKRNSRI